jgi:hypothetical protein
MTPSIATNYFFSGLFNVSTTFFFCGIFQRIVNANQFHPSI